MYAWYKGQRAKLLVQNMLHIASPFEVPMHEVLMTQSPSNRMVWSGFLGGFFPWVVALTLFVAVWGINLIIMLLSGGFYALPMAFGRLFGVIVAYIPWAIISGVGGVFLGFLRLYGIRTKRKFKIIGMQWGLNTLVMTILGLVYAVFNLQYAIYLGPFLFFIGFIMDGIWESFHNLALERLSGPQQSELLAGAVRKYLIDHPQLSGFELHSVRVTSGRTILSGVWSKSGIRKEIDETLRDIEGVNTVVFETAMEPVSS